jgi:hypothetical protein
VHLLEVDEEVAKESDAGALTAREDALSSALPEGKKSRKACQLLLTIEQAFDSLTRTSRTEGLGWAVTKCDRARVWP